MPTIVLFLVKVMKVYIHFEIYALPTRIYIFNLKALISFWTVTFHESLQIRI